MGRVHRGIRGSLLPNSAHRREHHSGRRSERNGQRDTDRRAGPAGRHDHGRADTHPVLQAGHLPRHSAEEREHVRPVPGRQRHRQDCRPAEHHQPRRGQDHRQAAQIRKLYHAAGRGQHPRGRGRHEGHPAGQRCDEGAHRRLRSAGQRAARPHLSGTGLRRGAAGHRHYGFLPGPHRPHRHERQGQGVRSGAVGRAPGIQARDEGRGIRCALRSDVQVQAGVHRRATAGRVVGHPRKRAV